MNRWHCRSLISAGALLALAYVSLTARSSADDFGSGANSFTIDFVPVGNVGNLDDSSSGGGAYFSLNGAVPYTYRIAVTEVPQDWVTRATNLGLSNVASGPWTGLLPAATVSWYEAAAFVNFLNTSTGHQPAYNLTFSGTWSMTPWSSANAWQMGGENVYRHKDTFYFLPSEDEWYKAAYHANDGATGNYFDYATGSNTIPTSVVSGTASGTVVYALPGSSSPAAVSSNGGLSPYGTRGQNGNIWEWSESALDGVNNTGSEARVFRGGDFSVSEFSLRSSTRNGFDPASANALVGFRIASVPEPSATLLIACGASLYLLGRRRSVIA